MSGGSCRRPRERLPPQMPPEVRVGCSSFWWLLKCRGQTTPLCSTGLGGQRFVTVIPLLGQSRVRLSLERELRADSLRTVAFLGFSLELTALCGIDRPSTPVAPVQVSRHIEASSLSSKSIMLLDLYRTLLLLLLGGSSLL